MTHILGKASLRIGSSENLSIASYTEEYGAVLAHTSQDRTGIWFTKTDIGFVTNGVISCQISEAGVTTKAVYTDFIGPDDKHGFRYNRASQLFEVCHNGHDWCAIATLPEILPPRSGGTGADLSGVVIPSLLNVLPGGKLDPSRIIDNTSNRLVLSTTPGDKEILIKQSGIIAVTDKVQEFTNQIFRGEELVPELYEVCIGGGVLSAGKAIKLVGPQSVCELGYETGYVLKCSDDLHITASTITMNTDALTILPDHRVIIGGALSVDKITVAKSLQLDNWVVASTPAVLTIGDQNTVLYIQDSGVGIGASPEAKLHVAGGAESRPPTSREVLISAGMVCPGRRTDWAARLQNLDPATVTVEELAKYVKMVIEEGRRIGIYG